MQSPLISAKYVVLRVQVLCYQLEHIVNWVSFVHSFVCNVSDWLDYIYMDTAEFWSKLAPAAIDWIYITNPFNVIFSFME